MKLFFSIVSERQKNMGYYALLSMAFTFVLFYIDEGYYNFNWTKQLWNWVFFCIYTLFMFLGQLFVQYSLQKREKMVVKKWLVFLIGAPLGLMVLFVLGYSLKTFLND